MKRKRKKKKETINKGAGNTHTCIRHTRLIFVFGNKVGDAQLFVHHGAERHAIDVETLER
jgi:hypothetical protein